MASSPPPTTIQPYGKASKCAPMSACLSCSKSKCKCVNRPDGRGCVRCRRLNKPCVPGEYARKAAAQKNNPVGRIAQLESKLDELISALGTTGRVASLDVSSSSPAVHDLAGQNACCVPSPHQGSAVTAGGATISSITPLGVPNATTTPASPSPRADLLPVFDFPPDVEDCLHSFCHRMLKYFPFMSPPTDLAWVRRERPFLLLCICAATSKSTPTRLALGTRIKQTVADKLLLGSHGTVSIDILLGLLTFLAWGHDTLLKSGINSFSRFTQLAMMVVFELRLNRPPTQETNMLSINKDDTSDGGGVDSREPSTALRGSPEHTLEERRAMMGCFYMSAVISSYFGQIDALQWTPYMEESLIVLDNSKECATDESFVHQIRLQRLSSEMENIRHQTAPPHSFYLKALRSNLDNAKGSIPQHLQSDAVLLDHVHFAELSILELALSRDTPSIQRVDCLYTCLQVVRAAMDNFLALPPAENPAKPFPCFVHQARSIKVAVDLSTLEDPAWDKSLARQTVDVLQFLDKVITDIRGISGVGGGGGDGDLWSATGYLTGVLRVFTAVRAWAASKLLEEGPSPFDQLDPLDMWATSLFSAATFECPENLFS
ncbi:hypothetical protein PG993_008947 [Apiospora rasikravindrae]|uniref:Zn(2)-C6 fungal-type domain-containing protein n=1 Tax=Apiospora rasikravindrae TaxID=990691 RepID=A0ABR1SS42_9PEZI